MWKEIQFFHRCVWLLCFSRSSRAVLQAGLCRGPAWRGELNPLLYPRVPVGKLEFRLQAVKCCGGWGLAGAGSRCPLPRVQSVSLGVTRSLGSDTGLAAALCH